MPTEQLTCVYRNICRTPSYLIGSHRITKKDAVSYRVICNSLTIWIGILLDCNTLLGHYDQEGRGYRGRILSMPICSGLEDCDLTQVLTFLDEVDDWLLSLASSSTRFKGELPSGITTPASCRPVMGLIRRISRLVSKGELGDVEAVKMIHQVDRFLSKIEVDRPDLQDSAKQQFLQFEDELSRRSCLRADPETSQILSEMNALARIHLADWTPGPLYPSHGPGAVADVGVKCQYDKYLHMATDDRIDYVLRHYDLGSQTDYCPWVHSEKSTRTSRFVAVPKSWKKLRGISAEPAELQFYQHAVAQATDRLFCHDKWWRDRVNLHDQAVSQQLALIGSATDSYCTIDLSAASDSVTLELVKEVFKGTPMLSWLLATRSTKTVCGSSTVRIKKFAPMGSACCFPVECIVFALAAQVASDRTRVPMLDQQTVRVFGDDIITDWYSASELLEILNKLGFKVNTDKTYLVGGFREACGTEAYRGKEIRPWRYKRLGFDFSSSSIPIDEVSTLVSYANAAYGRGFIETRQFILHILQQGVCKIGKSLVPLKGFLTYSFSGELGNICSPMPTNYLRCRRNWSDSVDLSDRKNNFQTTEVLNLGSRIRLQSRVVSSEMSELFSWILYHEWLLGHQAGMTDWDSRWQEGYLLIDSSNTFDRRIPLGFVVTPTKKWVPWNRADTLA